MKRWFFVAVMLTALLSFPSSLGILAGSEFGGRGRIYLGAKAELGDEVRIGVDAYLPIESFTTAGEELTSAQQLEIDPLILVSLPLGKFRLYAGAGPILILDISNMEFGLYSYTTLRGKLGAAMKLSKISVFLEAISTFSYSPFMIGNVLGAQAGISIGF